MYARFTSAGPLPSVLLNFLSSLVMPVVTQPPNSVNFSDDEDSASDRWNLRIDELLIIITYLIAEFYLVDSPQASVFSETFCLA